MHRSIIIRSIIIALFLAASGFGQVTYVATTSAKTASATTLTYSKIVASGSNRALVVTVGTGAAGAVTSVTFNGVAMTSAGGVTLSANDRAEVWCLAAPTVTTANVVVTVPVSTVIVSSAIDFTGADQITPCSNFTSAIGTSTAPSVTVTTASGEIIVDSLTIDSDKTGSLAVGANQTQRSSQVQILTHASSTQAGSDGGVMSWSFTGSESWGSAAVSVRAPTGVERFASPGGSGSGTLASPWSLTAACTDSNVTDGDIVYLRGGTYAGPVTCNLAGSSGSRITFRSYPGESAIIEGSACTTGTAVLNITGSYTTYQNLEIKLAASCSTRTWTASTFRTNGVEMSGANNRLILNVIRDTGMGVVDAASTNETSDNLFYNLGNINTAADKTNGHCVYPTTSSANSIIKRNICINTYGFGFHAWNAGATGYNIDGNIWARCALLSGASVGPFSCLLIEDNNGGSSGSHTINANMLYAPLSFTGHSSFADATLNLGGTSGTGGSGQGTFTTTGNYVVGGVPAISLGGPDALTMTGNTVISNNYVVAAATAVVWSPVNNNTYQGTISGNTNWIVGSPMTFTSWQATPLFWDLTGSWTSAVPSTNQNFVLASIYDAGRGIIAIYNWAGGNTATVDISSVAAAGKYVLVYSAQNYPAGPIWTGIYSGGNITLATNGASVNPIGGTAEAADTAFGAYVMTFGDPTFRKQAQ